MSSNRLPRICKAKIIQGRTLRFRDAIEDDAKFILTLRTDSQKSRYLSATDSDIRQQKTWLNNYTDLTDQAYFIIEDLEGQSLGTVRLYDAQGKSFCWGSWILKEGAPQAAAIESALMVYSYAIDYLVFSSAHFDVRKDNESVWRFHERFGAQRIAEEKLDYLYKINADNISRASKKYKKYLPETVRVTGVF